ncbi:DUF2207 family protein [Nesterenkonia alba]|uniref:DUF2207 family protein n=1 Tax=Nesterenkonia alba TaxID=515814 RepID=UPI0003B66443|nr:DUF2207 domain-containing protein [Nesterenkonia alba]
MGEGGWFHGLAEEYMPWVREHWLPLLIVGILVYVLFALWRWYFARHYRYEGLPYGALPPQGAETSQPARPLRGSPDTQVEAYPSVPARLPPAEAGALKLGLVGDEGVAAVVVDLTLRGHIRVVAAPEYENSPGLSALSEGAGPDHTIYRGLFAVRDGVTPAEGDHYVIARDRSRETTDPLRDYERTLLDQLFQSEERTELTPHHRGLWGSQIKRQILKHADRERLYRRPVGGPSGWIRREVIMPLTCLGFLAVAVAGIVWGTYMFAEPLLPEAVSQAAGVFLLVYIPFALAALGSWNPGRTALGQAMFEQTMGFDRFLTEPETEGTEQTEQFRAHNTPEDALRGYAYATAVERAGPYHRLVLRLITEGWVDDDTMVPLDYITAARRAAGERRRN